MTEKAKNLLCNDPAAFKRDYGDYYVTGYEMGASLSIELRSKSLTESKEEAVSAAIEASWSGFGATVEGEASFKDRLSESKTLTSSNARVVMEGNDKGKTVESMDVDHAEKELVNFAKIGKNGKELTAVLVNYDTHRDWIETKSDPKC
jgi:hypothetical protein